MIEEDAVRECVIRFLMLAGLNQNTAELWTDAVICYKQGLITQEQFNEILNYYSE